MAHRNAARTTEAAMLVLLLASLSCGSMTAAHAQDAGSTTTTSTTHDTTNGTTTTTVTTHPNDEGNGPTTITVTVNKEPIRFPENGRPRMLGGRVMVPLRGVIERLGGSVLYDAATQVITGAHPGTSDQFRLRVGSDQALVNGKNVTLDTPPRVIAGTTYVPLRFVSEALGAQVSWDNANHTVVISAAGNETTVKTAP